MKTLPNYMKKYFWEVDFSKLDLAKFRIYILKRLMEYGDEKAIRWLKKVFSIKEIKKVLIEARGFSPRSANFWRLLVGLEPQKVLCLQKPYIAIRKKFWID